MREALRKLFSAAWVVSALLVAAAWTYGGDKSAAPRFKYFAGTEKLPRGCSGMLQVTETMLNFTCAGEIIAVPYSSITLMQYRPGISKRVRRMKIKWGERARPSLPFVGGKDNRYFTVVFSRQGETRVMVLEVREQWMQPYLAEIDLKSGRRVEVKGHEEYD